MEDSNRSSNPSIHDVSDPARRLLLRGGLGLSLGALLAHWGTDLLMVLMPRSHLPIG